MTHSVMPVCLHCRLLVLSLLFVLGVLLQFLVRSFQVPLPAVTSCQHADCSATSAAPMPQLIHFTYVHEITLLQGTQGACVAHRRKHVRRSCALPLH